MAEFVVESGGFKDDSQWITIGARGQAFTEETEATTPDGDSGASTAEILSTATGDREAVSRRRRRSTTVELSTATEEAWSRLGGDGGAVTA